jgi:hypothetical protein
VEGDEEKLYNLIALGAVFLSFGTAALLSVTNKPKLLLILILNSSVYIS